MGLEPTTSSLGILKVAPRGRWLGEDIVDLQRVSGSTR